MNGKLRVAGILLASCLVVVLAKNLFYPYGIRTCRLPCMLSALRSYAQDNDGDFPGGENSLQALSLIYPDYMKHVQHLAGISGDEKLAERLMASGRKLDSVSSSWIYHLGLRSDDLPNIAIIWESREGLGFNGKRAAGHAVGFVDGSMRQIHSSKWGAFCEEQQILRSEVLKSRMKATPPKP